MRLDIGWPGIKEWGCGWNYARSPIQGRAQDCSDGFPRTEQNVGCQSSTRRANARPMHKTGLQIAFICAALSFSASRGRCDDRGKVMREWTNTIGQLGLTPIFPPREDVQVGDIYVFRDDPSGDFLRKLRRGDVSNPFSSRWDSLDLNNEIVAEYRRRQEWPSTPLETMAGFDEGDEKHLLKITDIANIDGWARRLHSPSETDALSKYLYEQLSGSMQRAIRPMPAVDVGDLTLVVTNRVALVADLNRIMREGALWDRSRFANIALRPATLQTANASPQGRDLLKINRFLLEEAYPTFISPALAARPVVLQPTSEGDIFTLPATSNRLRLVAFPDFVASSFTRGAVNALIPAEAINAAIGIVAAKEKVMSVKVSSAEEYSLPAKDILGKLLSNTIMTDKKDGRRYIVLNDAMQSSFRPLLVANMKGGKDSPSMWMQVITQVYYARSMDISIQAANAVQFGGNANISKNAARPAAGSLPTIPANVSAVDSATTVSALNSMLSNTGALSTPSSSVAFIGASVVNGSTLGVSMRRIWEHPVALGFRGWSMKLELHGNEVRVIKMEPTKNDIISRMSIQP